MSLLLMTSAALSIGSGIFVYNKFTLSGRKPFSYAFFSMAMWALMNSIELIVEPVPLKIFLTKLSYIGIVTSAPLLFYFSAAYTGREKYFSTLWQVIIWFVPALVLLSAFTNELHHFQWKSYTLKESIAGAVVLYGSGPGVYLIAIYSYLLLTVSYVFLIRHFYRKHKFYRKQLLLILLSFLIPWVLNITYITRINPVPELDFAPVGLFFSSIVILIAILRYKLFRLLPQAKEILFDQIPDPIFVVDTNLRITDLNPAAEKLWPDKDKVNVKITQLLPDIRLEAGLIPPNQIEYRFLKEGNEYWFNITVSEIRDRDKILGGYLMLMHDITLRKLNEESLRVSESKLRELNASKDRFFSIIAHDLKNPFSNIINISKILSDDHDTMTIEERTHFLQLLSKVSRSSYELLENLLQWSRSQTGSLQFTPEPVILMDIFRRAYNEVQYSAMNKKIEIIIPESAADIVYVDPNIISVVFRNLLMNAVKFSYPGGVVEISYVSEKEKVIIKIKDNGIGISAKILPYIFNLANNTSRRGTANETGTGLGLVLCKEFVEKNRGEIWVESTEGKGAAFYVTLLKTTMP